MEICKMLTLSTSFVSNKTASLLDKAQNDDSLGIAVYPKCSGKEPFNEHFGWFIYPGEDLENVPDDLADALAVMRSMDCQMLCLDCDGPERDDDPAVSAVMTISTCHIGMDTAKMLDRNDETDDIPVIVYPKLDGDKRYGWYIYFDNAGGDMPKDLRECLGTADRNGCGVLVIDSDGPVIDTLTKYGWE